MTALSDRFVDAVAFAIRAHGEQVRKGGPVPELWSRFKEGPEQQVWDYRTLTDIFVERLPPTMTDELQRVIDDLTTEVSRSR